LLAYFSLSDRLQHLVNIYLTECLPLVTFATDIKTILTTIKTEFNNDKN